MLYPALEVAGAELELVLALVHDYAPSGAEERERSLTIVFTTASDRERAQDAIARQFPDVQLTPRDIDDENWASRSQANLEPVTVDRLTIAPPWALSPAQPASLIVIAPSTGFGTGHHPTTRLCLRALQTIDLRGAAVIDVGTGSGILALAAAKLGARAVIGIDIDADAIRAARESLALNPGHTNVVFEQEGLEELAKGRASGDRADVVLANLTGTALIGGAAALAGLLAPAGILVASGLLPEERRRVARALSKPHNLSVWCEREEEGWIGFVAGRGRPLRWPAGSGTINTGHESRGTI